MNRIRVIIIQVLKVDTKKSACTYLAGMGVYPAQGDNVLFVLHGEEFLLVVCEAWVGGAALLRYQQASDEELSSFLQHKAGKWWGTLLLSAKRNKTPLTKFPNINIMANSPPFCDRKYKKRHSLNFQNVFTLKWYGIIKTSWTIFPEYIPSKKPAAEKASTLERS